MNVRECKQCHKMVDFDEPWCDHETMEESALLDIRDRLYLAAREAALDDSINKALKDLKP